MPALSPADIEQKQFLVVRRGFDRDEVSAFLHEVALRVHELERDRSEHQTERAQTEEQLGRLGAELSEAKDRVRELSEELADTQARADEGERDQRAAEMEPEAGATREGTEIPPSGRGARPAGETGEGASATLQAVIDLAERIRSDAEGDAARIRRDAVEEKARVQREIEARRIDANAELRRLTTELSSGAEVEARSIREDAAAILKAARAEAASVQQQAHRRADDTVSSAKRLAHVWEVAAQQFREAATGMVLRDEPPPPPPVSPRPVSSAPTEQPGVGTGADVDRRGPATPADGKAQDQRYQLSLSGAQARAAATSVIAQAREDLRLAALWIHEAEQGASADTVLAARGLLKEADHLMETAVQLGQAPTDLIEEYLDLHQRAQQVGQ